MLACRCPNCSAPTPISLGSTTIGCDACGFSGPPSEEVAEAQRQATEVARGLDVKERQLDRWQRKLVASSIISVVIYLVVAGFVTLPLVLVALMALWMTADGLMSWDGLVFFVSPALISLAAAGLGIAWIRRSRQILQSAAAAIPPSTSGGTASCRVCGAPLVTTTEAVTRCEYCESDNLVSPAAFRRAAKTRLELREDLAQTTQEAATNVGRASRRAGCVVGGVGCAAPIVVVVVTTVLVLALTSVERPLGDERSYALVETTAGLCVAHVNVFDDHVRLSYGGRTEDYIQPEDRPSAEGLEIRSPAFLVGRRVLVHHLRRSGAVTRVHGTLAGTVTVVIRADDGEELGVVPQGLCLLDQPQQGEPP